MNIRNRPILITGCQRSGTTLLHLILDSHPRIHGVDESVYSNDNLPHYLTDDAFHPNVSFKLPIFAHAFRSFAVLPTLKTIWCVRHPLDTVASMLNLKVELGSPVPVPWAIHPTCAEMEIRNCVSILPDHLRLKLKREIDEYTHIVRFPLKDRSREHGVTLAAICWRIKNELLDEYRRHDVSHHVLRYEALVQSPEAVIRELLQYLDLEWHTDVLRHHQLHEGTSIGNTDNTRPIDAQNTNKWRTTLSEAEAARAFTICAPVAKSFGYGG